MTKIHDGAETFRSQVIDGLALAYPTYLSRVRDASGFSRAARRHDKVALVVGGGSGHYPSYAGIVGPGFADGCVMGEVFTSPSAEQVYRIGKATAGSDGLIFAFGNYAGDRLNFAAARDRLVADGIDVRIVYVTDDVASAKAEERDLRRGIAGTFVVYKIGGAAAESGLGLDEVEGAMLRANARTYSFGVAFDGCTLPGQQLPLFTVPEGELEFGLGIHGEAGVGHSEWVPAKQLASRLVSEVLAERPNDSGDRAAVVVNGLGSTKYEELFVLYGHIQELLTDVGVTIVAPEVGELVTSLDMEGCSLTVTWLDEELEMLWLAPADTPAFKRAAHELAPIPVQDAAQHPEADTDGDQSPGPFSADSLAAAETVREWLTAALAVVEASQDELGRLDAVAGDGDHGTGMVRGFAAAVGAVNGLEAGVATTLGRAARAFADASGGTSGMLWGVLLQAVADELSDSRGVTAADLAGAVVRARDALMNVGGAVVGDKTMLDALDPFATTLVDQIRAGASAPEAWDVASLVAERAAKKTEELAPRLGRARPLAERSIGHADPGATSMALILRATQTTIAERCGGGDG